MYVPYTLAGRGQANCSDRWLKDTLIVNLSTLIKDHAVLYIVH